MILKLFLRHQDHAVGQLRGVKGFRRPLFQKKNLFVFDIDKSGILPYFFDAYSFNSFSKAT